MKCPYCNSNTYVSNSRTRAKGSQTWRRRQCRSCSGIWTTHEVIDLSTSHKIRDAEKQLQPFSRDKLFKSILDSLVHRKTAINDATALTDTILVRILALNQPILTIGDLANTILGVLAAFDKTASAVYEASHRSDYL